MIDRENVQPTRQPLGRLHLRRKMALHGDRESEQHPEEDNKRIQLLGGGFGCQAGHLGTRAKTLRARLNGSNSVAFRESPIFQSLSVTL
jgi:hypothetical protein